MHKAAASLKPCTLYIHVSVAFMLRYYQIKTNTTRMDMVNIYSGGRIFISLLILF